jgi:GTP-binding protein
MKYVDAAFIFSTNKLGDYPKTDLPEFAFTGRSNVGKSSFINSIVLRKNLARISSEPGKTKSINFYSVNNKFILADMPGFGYAKTSKTEREAWKKMIYDYFLNRKYLKFVTVLVDCRHDPMPIDLSLIEWLENNNLKYIVVLTKIDKIATPKLQEIKSLWEEILSQCNNAIEVLPTSATTKQGIDKFITILKKYL